MQSSASERHLMRLRGGFASLHNREIIGGDGCSVALESGSIGSEVKSSVEIVEMCIINQTRCLSSLRLSPYHSALVQGMTVGVSSEDHLFGLL